MGTKERTILNSRCLALGRFALAANMNEEKERERMKKQLQGIALILIAILLMVGYGNEWFFDFSFRWSVIFLILGVAGVVMTFLPDRKDR